MVKNHLLKLYTYISNRLNVNNNNSQVHIKIQKFNSDKNNQLALSATTYMINLTVHANHTASEKWTAVKIYTFRILSQISVTWTLTWRNFFIVLLEISKLCSIVPPIYRLQSHYSTVLLACFVISCTHTDCRITMRWNLNTCVRYVRRDGFYRRTVLDAFRLSWSIEFCLPTQMCNKSECVLSHMSVTDVF